MLARAEARRYGWDAEQVNIDVDPLSLPFPNRPDIGRGDIVLTRDGRYVSFEYKLPEYQEDIKRTITEIIQSDIKVTDRALGKEHILEVM